MRATKTIIYASVSGDLRMKSFLRLAILLSIVLGASCTEPRSSAPEHKPTTNVENVVRHPVTGERILDKYPDITKHPLYCPEPHPILEQWSRERLDRLSAIQTRELLLHYEKKRELRKSLKDGYFETIENPVTGATEIVSNFKTATPASKPAVGKALRAENVPGKRNVVFCPAPDHEGKLITLPWPVKDGFYKCPYSGRIFLFVY